jgi:hypothetical protein
VRDRLSRHDAKHCGGLVRVGNREGCVCLAV